MFQVPNSDTVQGFCGMILRDNNNEEEEEEEDDDDVYEDFVNRNNHNRSNDGTPVIEDGSTGNILEQIVLQRHETADSVQPQILRFHSTSMHSIRDLIDDEAEEADDDDDIEEMQTNDVERDEPMDEDIDGEDIEDSGT